MAGVMRTDPERQAHFLDLVQAHQGVIRKVAALYARDRADREDLFQEILVQLWTSFGTFRGDAAFSTFLYRVALNTALMRLRRAYRQPAVDAARVIDDIAAPEARRHDEDIERLYGAIRQLGPIDRAIVLLVLEERSYEEIASVTGLSAGNVSVRLVRAKERLRRLMGGRVAAVETRHD
jgi:RNA polymerase sigma-70 factor (ECF subfamily)